MEKTTIAIPREKSKYIKNAKELNAFHKTAVAYVFALYVLPQYFGIPNPIFDFTAIRIMIIAVMALVITDFQRTRNFARVVVKERVGLVLLPYTIVLLYTMVLRADLNAFLNPFIDILEMFILIYLIRETLGVDGFIKLIMVCIYTLVFLGFVEMLMRESPFFMIRTIKSIPVTRFVRDGHYRIMSNAVHALGYGLMLVTMLPFAAYDVETGEFNVFRRPILLILLMVNVFQTGSRSTLGVSFAELFLMLILSDRKYLKANLFYLAVTLISFGLILVVTIRTSFGNFIMLQLTSLIDALFDTSYSVAYGADANLLRSSAAYRDLLKEIYHLDWLNPILGIGRKRAFASAVNGRVIKSIDNFYIAEYVRYAYPGMISFMFFQGYMLFGMIRDSFKVRSGIIRMCLIGSAMYCYNIKVVDQLQTFKYLYVLFAIYICADKTPYAPPARTSKYFKKEKFHFARYK